jgi:hypothetical protein
MIRECGAFCRDDLLFSMACNAQARALIGATTSRLVGFWLIQACSVATVPFPCLFGRQADSLNSTVVVLRAHRAAVNVTRSCFVASGTFPALGATRHKTLLFPRWRYPDTNGCRLGSANQDADRGAS